MKKLKKNEIYIKMLLLSIPYIRNMQQHKKSSDLSCYYEAELVHNLVYTILTPDFEDHDIYFLNNQARYYIENCSDDISIVYSGQKELISSLFEMVPQEMKSKLQWEGPK
ncbi:zinc ABC transporter substrate-binding protein [Pectobacterium aroidearum]|uniref:zinc ABC transporter substrate-binding protein n=1 Tax=Pectobacterium aroidearum TaxID=1201031 RepID=UPI001CD2A62B|nr:zinc ABC transporter substrate-binding protein [Pectobacterium aroidearum]UUE36461.1 zinc ABC transporter substrate-binding protein [Pectobacterium aroidearum]UUE40836.1 zinc ABC transporter substrate-binding protein [Pectobacterium aroidearum]UUE45183.1 zinc ABC transporter substrate-binding protein [Pectobacterium aroidearum]UUE49403.1 zinc ABC transporter substrate-binding protein [Pectobacterium aroidearum]UUE53607.1 zinc ABC transporter substrate-binding protein [Pectobacterium aroidea